MTEETGKDEKAVGVTPTTASTSSEVATTKPSVQKKVEDEMMRDRIIENIKTVFDPEIPVNIYELGLIYEIDIKENNDVEVTMTLTSPACPAAGQLPSEVETKTRMASGVKDVKVEVTFDPPWDYSMMTDEAKLELGFM